MRQFWMVPCDKCKKLTGAEPPHTPDFVKWVQCNFCDGQLDAEKGHFVLHPIRVKKPEPVDLLEIE